MVPGNRGNSTGIVEIPGGRGKTESWLGRIMEGQGWPGEATDGAVAVRESCLRTLRSAIFARRYGAARGRNFWLLMCGWPLRNQSSA